MAETLPTLADSLADALNVVDITATDLALQAPFLAMLPSETSSDGEYHRFTVQDTAPVVGFRTVNTGVSNAPDGDRQVNAQLQILDWSHSCDKADADVWRKGGRDAFLARKGKRFLQAAMFQYESSIINGSSSLAGSFDGMADVLDSLSNDHVIDAGSAGTDTHTSVYLVRLGLDDFCGVYRGDQPFNIGDVCVIEGKDGSNRSFPKYYVPACTWLGCQVGSVNTIVRIANLDGSLDPEGDIHHRLTDDLIGQGVSLFPAGQEPNAILVNRTGREQLRQSRQSFSPTGAAVLTPTDWEGIKIVTVNSITNTEATVN